MAGTKDIKDFTKYPSLSDNDYLLGTKTDLGGTDAGITVADFKKLVAQDVKPTIKNGYWWVNGVNTGELATGRTPQFRYTANGMEMKYDNEDDTAFRVIIPIEDLLFTFDDLTPEQVELLKLKFSDLTEAEKNELRGKAFTYADFTPDQLADLRLTWDKLTPGQKKELQGERGYSAFEVWEQQEGNTGKTVEDYLSWLRLPATSVALAIRKEMDQIAEEAEEVIRETNTAGEKADKAAVRANNAAEAAEGIVAGIVPTKTSDLENDSGFITKAVDDLANYYLKSEVYTREEVLNLISQMKSVSIQPVEVLPDIGETNIIYFLPKEGTEDDVYDEYIWISDKWERIGSTSVDLTNYYTKLQTFQTFQPRETGKRLMLDEEGEKLKKIHFIPTLNHEPGENDLTFTDSEGEHSFLIGDQARVVDTGKGGYVFWQLYDVVENKATWKKTGAGGSVMELTERLIVSLQTNQEYIQDPVLMGLVVHVKYADHDLELEYQGVPMSIDIPMSVVYTIEYPLLDGYNTPPRETHLALSGNERYSIGKYETTALNIELESNQGEDPALNGVGVMIEYDGKIKNLTWTNGESMIIKIPTGIECTVTAASLPGYKSPPAKVITPSGVTVNETFTYLTELVNVRLNAENGVSCSGQKVTIGGTEYTYESPVSVKIPYDTDYSVSVNSKAGFELPDPLYFSAGQRERDITVTYMAIKRGVFILDTSEKLIRKADWDTSNNSRAVGVAVLSDNCKFVISKKTINKKWCATSVLVTGIVTTTNSAEAIKDYKGKENTDKIYSQLGNSNAIAVDYCKNTVGLFPDNRPGYLGSAGEWEEAVNNFNEVKECMTLIGGEAFQSSSYPLWTSTQYSDKMAWTTYQNGSLTQSLKQNANYIRALASVDYPF